MQAELIHSNAARLRQLHDTLSKQPRGPEQDEACTEFHRDYDSLAFPGGLHSGLERLKTSDPQTIELTVQFLEADPLFFRSGYIKEKMLRRLKHCPLSEHQQLRLATLIVRSIDRGGRREFQGYSRLAGIIHPAMLVALVRERRSSSNAETARRARDVLHVLESNHVQTIG